MATSEESLNRLLQEIAEELSSSGISSDEFHTEAPRLLRLGEYIPIPNSDILGTTSVVY